MLRPGDIDPFLVDLVAAFDVIQQGQEDVGVPPGVLRALGGDDDEGEVLPGGDQLGKCRAF